MTLELFAEPARVVVSDADPLLRAAMADSLRTAGYDVVQVDHLGPRLTPELDADFAVVRCPTVEMNGPTASECIGDSAFPKLAIGWLRREGAETTQLGAASAAQLDAHIVRIFSAIAPLFMDIDREGAERLAHGIDALGSTIWPFGVGPTNAAAALVEQEAVSLP